MPVIQPRIQGKASEKQSTDGFTLMMIITSLSDFVFYSAYACNRMV